MGPNETYELLHRKETINKRKRQSIELGGGCANNVTSKGLISKIHQQLTWLNNKETNNPIKKLAQDLDISPKKTYRWPENGQINTVKYHLTMVRMATIIKSASNTCWRGCREKGTLIPYWWKCKLVQILWKTVWRFLWKLKTAVPYDPAIPLLQHYL